MTAKKTIPQGTTAREVLEGVTAKRWTKATAVAFLQERCEAAVAKGRIPRKASVDALAKLGVEFEFERDTVRTRKQIAKGTPTLRERRATAAAKPKARKTRKAAKPKADKAPSLEEAVAALKAQFGEDEVLAAYVKLLHK